jgi:hypothetical protein
MEEIKLLLQSLERELEKLSTPTAKKQLERAIKNVKRIKARIQK